MKLFYRESVSDYQKYEFGYTVWCRSELGDFLHRIYEAGFLPYSGRADAPGNFYMARSLRLDLARFSPSSENRRILRKADRQMTREETALENFDPAEPAFRAFCNRYFTLRHGLDVLESGKLDAILASGLLDRVVAYRDPGGDPAAYVLLVKDGTAAHFWFSFYDPGLAKDSLGMWLMIREAMEAQTQGLQYLYLGTCYSRSALYKTNLSPLEWWNGVAWDSDASALKLLVSSAVP